MAAKGESGVEVVQEKLCRRCKAAFSPATNRRSSCRFHPSFFVSRRHDDQRRGSNYFAASCWDNCMHSLSENIFD